MNNILYIHAGLPKTGTSSIQRFLNENRKALAEQGLYFPVPIGTRKENHVLETALLWKSLGLLENEFDYNPPIIGEANNFSMTLEEWAEKTIVDARESAGPTHDIILSYEGFWNLLKNADSFELLKNLFPCYDLKIIIYIRRIDEWIHSKVVQQLKSCKISINDFNTSTITKELYPENLLESFLSAEQRIGAGNLIIRPYERRQLEKQDIVADILKIVSSHFHYSPGSIQHNVTLPVESIIFLNQVVNSPFYFRSKEEREIASIIINSDKFKSIQGISSLFSPDERIGMIKRYSSVYKKFAKHFLQREDGTLFYDPLPDPAESWQPPDTIPETFLMMHKEVVSSLFCRIEELEDKVEDLQHHLRSKVTPQDKGRLKPLKRFIKAIVRHIREEKPVKDQQ